MAGQPAREHLQFRCRAGRWLPALTHCGTVPIAGLVATDDSRVGFVGTCREARRMKPVIVD